MTPCLWIALLGSAALSGQDNPPASVDFSDKKEPEWLDGTLTVVHDKVLLGSDIGALLQAELRNNPEIRNLSSAEQTRLRERLLDERVDQLLQIQACRDAGFDPVRIEELVDMRVESIVDSLGGPAEATRTLAQDNLTAADMRDDIRERLLGETWRQMITGASPGITGRVERDRYVRPGQMWAVYQIERVEGDPRWLELLGGQPERVVLQSLVLEITASGTKAALEQAEAIRAEALEGADFGQLVRTWSVSPEGNGIAKAHAVADVLAVGRQRHGEERFDEFVRMGEIGELSPPFASNSEAGERPLIYLYKIIDRNKADLPAFEEYSTQASLRAEIQRLSDERRERTAMRSLREALIEARRKAIDQEGQ